MSELIILKSDGEVSVECPSMLFPKKRHRGGFLIEDSLSLSILEEGLYNGIWIKYRNKYSFIRIHSWIKNPGKPSTYILFEGALYPIIKGECTWGKIINNTIKGINDPEEKYLKEYLSNPKNTVSFLEKTFFYNSFTKQLKEIQKRATLYEELL